MHFSGKKSKFIVQRNRKTKSKHEVFSFKAEPQIEVQNDVQYNVLLRQLLLLRSYAK